MSPHRTYSQDEIALFAQYRSARAECQPRGCLGGPTCWVELGPPACDGIGCKKCHCMPLARPSDREYGKR